MAVFLRCIEASDKAGALHNVTGKLPGGAQRYTVAAPDLGLVPTAPFAYWVTNRVREIFSPSMIFERDGRVVRQGLATSDDFRFVRSWFEVPDGHGWVPIVKGGARSTFYRDTAASVNWRADGAEVKAFAETTPGTKNWSRNIRNVDYYFEPGVSWPLRGIVFSAHAVPAGSIFSIAGKMAFIPQEQRLATLAIMNSSVFDRLMGLFAGKVGGVQYEAGLIRRTPMPDLTSEANEALSSAALRVWSLKRHIDMSTETSHAFTLPALLRVEGAGIAERGGAWTQQVSSIQEEVAALETEIDEMCHVLYDISHEDRASIATSIVSDIEFADEGVDNSVDSIVVDEGPAADSKTLAADLVSWCVGVGAGRFDARLATGARRQPDEPDPFHPLPAGSPAILTGENGMPMGMPPTGYPVTLSPMMVDDPGHRLDITARVRTVFDAVFGDASDKWWADLGRTFSARDREVGSWLSKGFFDHHLKMYSRSRRKAPVLWPLGTTSGSYLVWLYAHQVTGDSLFRVLSEIVAPKLALERRRLSELVQEFGQSPTASQRKAIDGQDELIDELQQFVDELNAVAPLWQPDLNDGIVITLAPLWRLFAHHKPWSKELHNHWVSLVAGKYDWAQSAMRLWPERVVPKCAVDRSLAIAHGLEDVYWIKDDDNPEKWHARRDPTVSVDQLIADRTDPAAKAALEDAVR